MDFTELINQLLYVAILAVGTYLVPYLVKLVKAQIDEVIESKKLTENERLNNLIGTALNEVMDAVVLVNQTYVDSLKTSGNFTPEAQKEAFNKAYVEALTMISEESKEAVEKLHGSFDKWLKSKIETAVNTAKK